MNRLLVSALILGTAAAVWLGRQSNLRHQRMENRALLAEVESLRSSAAEEAQRTTALTEAVAQAKADRDRVRATVRAEAVESPASSLPDPGKEGRFPAGKPYFYVAKQHLANFDLQLFEQDQLTPKAAVLFGLSDAERIAVNEAFESLCSRIAAVEAANVERLDSPGPVPLPGETNRTIIARLPALRSELAPLAGEFEETVRGILGLKRAELFLGHARSFFESDLHGLGSVARRLVVSRWPDGSETLQIQYEQGDQLSSAATSWPLPAAYRERQLRHLFPDRVPFDRAP